MSYKWHFVYFYENFNRFVKLIEKVQSINLLNFYSIICYILLLIYHGFSITLLFIIILFICIYKQLKLIVCGLTVFSLMSQFTAKPSTLFFLQGCYIMDYKTVL